MEGNIISSEIRARSNAGGSSSLEWGGIGDAVDLVSGLLEWALELLL